MNTIYVIVGNYERYLANLASHLNLPELISCKEQTLSYQEGEVIFLKQKGKKFRRLISANEKTRYIIIEGVNDILQMMDYSTYSRQGIIKEFRGGKLLQIESKNIKTLYLMRKISSQMIEFIAKSDYLQMIDARLK